MNVLVIGTGYVGLVSGTCFAELGSNVTCVDKDLKKINSLKAGEIPIYENGLESLVKKNSDSGRLAFSSDVEGGIKEADIIFIAVGTPPAQDGGADLSHVMKVAEIIAENAKNGAIIVTKSTVPVGTGDKINTLISNIKPDIQFSVASNPEFLREGNAVKDFLEPDRVVIGAQDEETLKKVARLYKPLENEGRAIVLTDRRTAELSKYASNSYLAMRIAYINEIADLCESCGADIEKVSEAMGFDHRIGGNYLKPGPGFGGSCFPKDTLALRKIGNDHDVELKITDAVINSNNDRKLKLVDKIISAAGGEISGKKISVLGLAFKANTDDIRDSSALTVIEKLLEHNAEISAYDPEALENTKKFFSNDKIRYENSTYDCCRDAEIIIILTEWNEFQNIDWHQVNPAKDKIIIDFRNLYNPASMRDKGFKYHSVGRV